MQYTEFTINSQGNLQIALTTEGKAKLEHLLVEHADWTDDEILLELIDEQLKHGWMIIPPEQIRAMRNLLILSNTVQYDDKGNIIYVEHAYWHPNDQVGAVRTILRQRGYIVFERGG